MPSYQLKFGKELETLEIEEKNLLGVLYPKELPSVSDQLEEVRRALKNPIASKPLSEMIKPGDKVAVMVSDITRPSPSKILLPPILEELDRTGVPDGQVTIVFGMGIHRNHTEEEKCHLVGEDIYRRYRCVDSTESDDYVSYGTTVRGTPIEICRPVAEADVRICTGNLEYHYCAGYSGGAKAIMPGASSRRSIEVHHALQLMEGSEIGRLDGNPFREDIEEIGKKVGIDFIVNAVLNEKKEIVRVVTGHPQKAHRSGCETIDRMYQLPIKRLADVVVVSAGGFPKDLNVYQAQKALENAQYAVKPGGTIILVAKCQEGAGEDVFQTWMEEANSPDEVLARLKQKFVMGGHKAAAIARVIKKAQIFLVSAMSEKNSRDLFFLPKASLQQALEDAIKENGPDTGVWVIPYGGSTLPKLS
ncbi:MAG: nickel-dependent lactate racemase [Desulfitobacteriaceae bacterium]|nr:nickel-dependent lactate racemase [Desulfitobacteriaceae bacterium]MDD4752986.1 nickel-dependent lactate racemase [Desulfitobacteriaceae bacterium]